MKRRIIGVLILFLLATSVCHSQIRVGIRGGVNFSQLKSHDEVETSDYRITYPNTVMPGYHFGLIGQIKLFNIFIQPEALYCVTRNDINIFDLNAADPDKPETTTQKLNRLEFPILLGFKKKIFKAGIGPVFTFLISENSNLKQITTYDLKWNKATVGFQAGIGLDVKKLAIDLKYEGSLNKIGDGIRVGNENLEFDSRLSQFIISIGLFL
jgi:hypothetical protein